jgi:hypothetical protein
MGKRIHQLPSQVWANGANLQIPTKDIPALARIKAFVFRLEGLFTTGAAAAAIASTQLHRLINMIDCGPGRRASGAYWHFLEWAMRGGEVTLPGGLPAANAEAHRRHITWVVPFFDRRAIYPGDDCPNGADFADKVITIETASFASLGAGTWDTLASIAGTLRCYAILDEPNDAIGADVEFGFFDLTGQAPAMDGGLYVDAFLYRENCATISSAQVATASITADGVQVIDITRLSEYARIFNEIHSLGADAQTASATAPVAGEYLPETPALTAGAADTVTVPWLPLITPPSPYRKTQALLANTQLRVDFTGTDTSFRVGYRRIKAHDVDKAVQRFQRIGRTDVRSPADFAAKTGSKKSLTGNKAGLWRYLPLRAMNSR